MIVKGNLMNRVILLMLLNFYYKNTKKITESKTLKIKNVGLLQVSIKMIKKGE